MTQPQYGYPPQQGYQPDPYAQQPPYYQAPVPGQPGAYQMQPQPPVYPGQYGPPPGVPNQGYGQPQQPPVPQGAKGTLDDFYGQPSGASGKGISWKNKPNGYRYVGVVRRTPVDSDVFQDSDPQTKTLKTWRDGSPKLVMPVPLDLVWLDAWQQGEYADREAAVFLRGGMRDEVTRAMQEAGVSGVPQQGALMDITLTHRKPGNNIATNMYAVVYRPAGTWETDPSYAWVAQALAAPVPQQAAQQQAMANPAPQGPYQQQAPAQYAAPAQAAPNPQQYAYGQPVAGTTAVPAGQPQYGGQAYDPNQYQQQAVNPPQGNGQPQYDPNTQGQQTPPGAYGAQSPQGMSGQRMQPAPNTQATQPPIGGPYTGQQVQAETQWQHQAAPVQANAAVQQPTPQGQVSGQQQLPYGNQPQAQPGVTPSQLNGGQQQLLARITGGQAQQGQPQG